MLNLWNMISYDFMMLINILSVSLSPNQMCKCHKKYYTLIFVVRNRSYRRNVTANAAVHWQAINFVIFCV